MAIRILIIEKDEVFCESTLLLLQKEGYLAYAAYDGNSGENKLRELHPDLVICGTTIPEKKGFALYNNINKNINSKIIPFIFILDKSQPSFDLFKMQLKPDEKIIAPYSPRDIVKFVNKKFHHV